MFGDSSMDLLYEFALETIKTQIADLEARKLATDRQIAGWRRIEALVKKFLAGQKKQQAEWAKRAKRAVKQAASDAKKRKHVAHPGVISGFPITTVSPVTPPPTERRAG